MSSGASPPKPWERAGVAATSSAAVPSSNTTSAATPLSTVAGAPALPSRPDSLSAVAARTASNYSSPYNHTAMSSPYGFGGGMGGMSSYSSPYNRFGGGMGSMGGMGGMYGGMGGMGGMYGGGGGMYGASPYGMQPGMPGQEQSLTQSFSQSTQATFQIIESIVGAFGGFAQMLESTYMATHSSFFAMVSVAEQFGSLRQTLGSVLGIFTVLRWIRMAVAKVTGSPPPASSKDLTPMNFAQFTGAALPDGQPSQPRPSKKPFIMFLLTVFGLPYLMNKLIKALAASQEAQQQQQQQQQQIDNSPYSAKGQQQPIDLLKLDFCRVLYDYTPEAQPGQQAVKGVDLAVKKGDLVAVLSKTDPMGSPSAWWRCRTRDGRRGYLPSPYLETIPRKPQRQLTAGSQAGSQTGSRAQTMTSTSGASSAAGSRANTMVEKERELVKSAPKLPPQVGNKPRDVSVESFQKSAFYS